MDKEEVAHIYNGILLSHKRNEIRSFVEMCMDLEIIILSKVSQEENDKYHITYIWNLKCDINEHIYETERDSHREQTCGCQGGWGGGGKDWEFGVRRGKLL